MNIYKNGYVYDNTHNEYIMSVSNEVYLSSLLNLDLDLLIRYFKGDTIIPVFRLFVLNSDETVHFEASSDVVSCNLNISYQSGQRRTMNCTLKSENDFWRYSTQDPLWTDTKFRLDTGVVIGDTLYWQQQGVFMNSNVAPSISDSNRTTALTLCDKWGLWDGTVFGNTQLKTVIPTQVPMEQVFNDIIHEDNGLGEMWDQQPIVFNSQYSETLTYYTIKQDAGTPKSQYLLDMANTISSDLYYDTYGRLNVESNTLDFINNNFPVVWRFDETDMDCGSPSLSYKRSDYYNYINTKGAIVNGYQFSGAVENRNLKSLYNVYDTPLTPKTNSNTKLYSDNLCLEQSMYEMVQQSRGLRSLSLPCGYLPFLDVNMAIEVNFPSLGIDREMYIIDSISYNMATTCNMNLNMTSNYEIAM